MWSNSIGVARSVVFRAEFVKVGQRFLRGTEPRQITAACQKDDFICQHDILGGMRDHDDRAPLIGQSPHQTHQFRFHAGVETQGGFIEEEQTWLGQQFDTNGNAFLLTTAQPADLYIAAMS